MEPERSFVPGEVYKWIKASSMLLIWTQILLQTMLHQSNGAMLTRLLGLLVLASLCSAMLPPNLGYLSSDWPDDLSRDLSSDRSSDPSSDSSSDPSSDSSSELPGSGDSPGFRSFHGSFSNGSHGASSTGPGMLNPPFLPPCWHCKGAVGPKGDRGDRGPPGAPGSPGRRGMTGFKGRQGFTGSQGIKGQKGDLGEKGQPGNAGFPGMKGGRGFKGEKGDRGLDGPTGPQGPQGETGTCPASCESVQGPPGTQGPPGPAGGRGLPGVKGSIGPKGFKGDKGELGRPGSPGVNGVKGDQGEQGVCECTDGSDGTPGQKGAKGDKGDTGSQGVKGTTGSKGSQGDMGLMGRPGPCSPAIQSAFSACINQSFPRQNWPVAFHHVLTNQQGHFNPMRGIYTAPVNGTYVFSFHLAVADRALKVGLFLNYYPIIRATEATDRSTTSQTIVLHLAMGDRVWLQVKSSETNGMYTDSESSSTFSGYLLHPDSCELSIGRQIMPWTTHEENYGWDGPPDSTITPQL